MPEMIAVDSSSIAAIGYDEATRDLYVRFRESGETYVYEGVEAETVEDFLSAESKGRFLNFEIKNRYRFRRLS